MSRIERSIEVDVPCRVAYDQWTQFESFPSFMEGVDRVVQVDDRTLEWTADVAGVEKHWRAQIVDQTPDERIAWRSVDGTPNDGVVRFEPLTADRTRISLALDAEPHGPVESTGDALGFLDRRVKGDLKRFKEFIEARRVPTGAWRGTIDGPTVQG